MVAAGRDRGFRGRMAELSQPGTGAAAARPRPHRDAFAARRRPISNTMSAGATRRCRGLSLAAAALQRTDAARVKAGGIDPIDGVSERRWRDRLASRFAAELEAKPAYAQFRIIGLEDGGRELVRVDRSGPNGAVRIVPGRELQPKGERSQLLSGTRSSCGPGRKSTSRRSICGRSNGLIETPHRPTLRVATPIFAADGKPFGIFIDQCRHAAARSTASGHRCGRARTIYVVNQRGDYLVHPDPRSRIRLAARQAERLAERLPASGGVGRSTAGHRPDRPGSGRTAGRDGARARHAGRHANGSGSSKPSRTPSSWRRRRASGTPPCWSG